MLFSKAKLFSNLYFMQMKTVQQQKAGTEKRNFEDTNLYAPKCTYTSPEWEKTNHAWWAHMINVLTIKYNQFQEKAIISGVLKMILSFTAGPWISALRCWSSVVTSVLADGRVGIAEL